MKRLLILFFLCCSVAQATTRNAVDCTRTAVNTQIGLSAPGDTVIVPAGTCDWTGGLSISGISLIGAGKSTSGTVITAGTVAITKHTTQLTRLSGFRFTGGDQHTAIGGSSSSRAFILDNDYFLFSSQGTLLGISVNGGVIYNCDIISASPTGADMMSINPSEDWSQAVTYGTLDTQGPLGGERNIYFENNNFTNILETVVDGDNGSRIVLRYNNMTDSGIVFHGGGSGGSGNDSSSYGVREFEIYNNQFHRVSNTAALNRWVRVRGGTGVIANNAMDRATSPDGFSFVKPDLVFGVGCSGGAYPRQYQAGQSNSTPENPPSHPILVFGNTGAAISDSNFYSIEANPNVTCSNPSSYIALGRDYVTSNTWGWTPLAYPHPLIAAINGTAIPGLVRWASGSSSNTNSISGGGPASNYTFRLPEGTQAGNSIALCVVSDDTATTPTVTDDKGNSWSLITTSGADASNHMKVRLWLASNVAFGTRTITPAFTPSVSRLAVTGAEFYNLGTADVSGSSVAASSTSMFAGSITPTQAGDLVYMCGARSSVPLVNSATPYTVGSQTNITWNLQATDNWDGLVSQWGVQTVAGTINPQLTMGTASAYVSASMAIRAATAGSALPTGMQVVGIGHYNHASNIAFATVTPKIIQFPTTGNLVVASIGPGGANYSVSSITDSNSNTWASTGAVLGDANAGKSQRFYAQNATAGNNLRLTANWTGASDNMDSTVLLYDVVGAAASSFTQHYSNYIFGSVGPGSFTAYSNVAPGTSNGIGFAQMSVAFNTICGSNNSVMVAPAAGLCDSYSYGGEPLNGPQPVDQNNGWSHYTFNTNANQTWTWPVQSAGTSLSEIASTLDFFSASPILPALPVPIFDHVAGAYTTSVNPLVIASRTPGATVCYRIGATPAATVTGTCDAGSTPGTASVDGNNQASLVVSSTSTVQALATKAGFTNSAVTSNAYTITAGCADPVISGLTAVSAANGQSITVTWTTDVPSDSLVAYGYSNPGFATPLTDTAGVTSHSVTINGLRTGTLISYIVRTRKIVSGLPCGNGYFPTVGNSGSITTATPTGANLTYGISAIGPTYVTQGNKMYFRINLNAKTGAFGGVKLVLTGLPANTTVGWADQQIFNVSSSVVSTTNAPFTGDTLTMNASSDCPGQANPYSCDEEPFLITTGSTPTGVANVTITVTATGTCGANCVQVLTWPVTVVSSAAPFNGVALPQVTPSSYPAIPGQAAYISDAVTYGLNSCPQDVTGTSATRNTYRRNDNTNMLGNPIAVSATYGSWFYDGTLGNYNVSTMLETTPSSGGNWAQCVENQKNWYTKVYNPVVQLGIAQYIMMFSAGAYNDYKVTGDPNTLFQVQANINRTIAPYHGGSVSVGYLQREVSYALRNSTHGVALGLNCIPISGAGNCFNVTTTVMRDFMMEHELGQIDQLCLSQNASYYEHFMMGLMAEDLLEYYDVANKDPRIPPAIACLANWMYTNYWQTAQGGTFPYDKASNYFSGTYADSGSCLATLDNMIAPMFAWLYRYTGDVTWQTEGDEIFFSGTTFRNCGNNNAASIMSFPPAGNSGGKSYSQNYHWPKYIEWRSAPAFQVFPGSVGFFNIPVSTQSGTRTVTLSNPTTSIVNITSSIAGTGYAITGGTCGASLAAATWLNPSTCTIQLKLTVGATQLATYPGTLTVNGIPVSLYGTGTSGTVATPTITPSAPGSYAAGTPFLISSATSGATLCLSDANDDGLANSFTVPFGSGANGPGGTCTSGHSYPNPTTLTLNTVGGQYIRAVATKANMEDSVAAINQINITASTAPIVSLSQTSLSFITNRTVTSAPQTVRLTNTGTANLTISQVSISGFFAQSNNCPIGPPLAPANFCDFTITSTPASTGVFNGTLTINDNAAGSPHTVALSVTSTAPVISLLPATYSFGNIALNTTAVSSAFTLQNTGNGPLAVNLSIGGTQPTFFGIFATNCPATLSAGSSCTITVRFSPLTAISYTAALIETDPVATGSPTNNTLIGTGVTPVTPAPVAPLPWIFL